MSRYPFVSIESGFTQRQPLAPILPSALQVEKYLECLAFLDKSQNLLFAYMASDSGPDRSEQVSTFAWKH